MQHLEMDQSIIPENRVRIQTFLRDCALGKTVLGKSKKRIGVARRLKYLRILGQLSAWFGKPFDEVAQSDMENLVEKLESNQIRQDSGKPYSEATKADIKKTIKKFWKWKDGGNRTYPELVAWIESYEPKQEVPALSRDEVEKVIEHTASARDKALLMVLFDSGARIEELLNVRLKPEHLVWKPELGCYMVRLEFSKTKPRTISLPLSTRYLKAWLDVHPARGNPQVQLFPMEYGNRRMLVGRIGRRVLGKRVTPHMLRHSSATFYANRIKNRYKLCYRYGWAMSSDMVDRYLDREGLFEEETVDFVRSEEATKAQRRENELSEELTLMRESQTDLLNELARLKQELSNLKSGQGILSLLMQLDRRRKSETAFRDALPEGGFDSVLTTGGAE